MTSSEGADLLGPGARLALLMHGQLRETTGKMGLGILRYSPATVVAVVDRDEAGGTVRDITGIDVDVPVVATIAEAAALGSQVVVVAVATAGGVLPEGYRDDLIDALRSGQSVVNGLHAELAGDPELVAALRPGARIWDVRREPAGLMPGAGLADELSCRRVLTVGTDMSVGKMTTSIELHRAAVARGLRSHVVATGQIGICLTGAGVALDAVRVDFASGAVEAECLRHGSGRDVLWIEGQGSMFHPGSTAWAALLAGSQPTDLVLVHAAGRDTLFRYPDRPIPPLDEVVARYEQVASATRNPGARVRAIALNGAGLDDETVERAVRAAEAITGLPTADPLRGGVARLIDAVLGSVASTGA